MFWAVLGFYVSRTQVQTLGAESGLWLTANRLQEPSSTTLKRLILPPIRVTVEEVSESQVRSHPQLTP